MIGHTAIKMLTYVEMLEAELKQALTNSFNKKKEVRESDADASEDGKK